jgi:hypothetical protein
VSWHKVLPFFFLTLWKHWDGKKKTNSFLLTSAQAALVVTGEAVMWKKKSERDKHRERQAYSGETFQLGDRIKVARLWSRLLLEFSSWETLTSRQNRTLN